MMATILPNKAHRAMVSIMAKGVYCGLSTSSEVFLIFTTQLYQYVTVFFLFALSDEPEVFLPEYSQTAILLAAHFWRVVKGEITFYSKIIILSSHLFM